MLIEMNKSKIKELENVIKTHDFAAYFGFTRQYRGFEIPNLNNEVKMSVLRRLSTENWRDVPCFTDFWEWFRKKHGMQLAEQICTHMFPTDEVTAKYMANCMRNKRSHDWWNHIKARIYKTWCSILTEMQAVYAVVHGASQMDEEWGILASSDLDAAGVDFVVVTKKCAIPVQVKKDSFHQVISHKQNGSDNFTLFNVTKRAQKMIEKELTKNKIDACIQDGLLLKYGLPENDKPAYPYLKQYPNNFVYFDSRKLVSYLKDAMPCC